MTVRSEPLARETEAPIAFALHFLGGSARQWTPLGERLAGRLAIKPLDLPGFGESVDVAGYTVSAMAEQVAARIREQAPRRWVLVGHSMGAKVACAVARLSEDGASGLEGLSHLVLLAGSPPRPEPMDEAKRREMLGWFRGSEAASHEEAVGYIRDNVGLALPQSLSGWAVEDVRRARLAAWVAWLESGSREDWVARIGSLTTPALIVAGAKDAALGPDCQVTMMAPHFTAARLEVVPNAGHLLPLECPDVLAGLMVDFLDLPSQAEPGLGPRYRALIDSDRVSPRTRQVLLQRLEPAGSHPDLLTDDEDAVLKAVIERVIPQRGGAQIDIATRIVHVLATGGGDGWRFSDLPTDVVAFRSGLRSLDSAVRQSEKVGFASLSPHGQDTFLTRMGRGELEVADPNLDGWLSSMQMKLWFEDLRSAAAQIYVAHPATQERLGYSGIANRGDGSGPQGFVRVGLGDREAWEPCAVKDGLR